jgi:signal transduction histidine kinase
MLKKISPQTLISICFSLCLLVVASCIAIAIKSPWLGIHISPDEKTGWKITHIHSKSPNSHNTTSASPLLSVNMSVIGFDASGVFVPLSPELVIEEPDVLPDYTAFNQLMRTQSTLTTAAQNNQLYLVTAEQQRVQVQTSQRPLGNLPLLFWFQLFVGVSGALTGALVWSSRRFDSAALLYALTGFGYLIFAPAAAIYSTRELIIDGDTFRLLSALNHLGALFFTASLTNLLWSYPHKLGSPRFIYITYLIALLAWLNDTFQLSTPTLFHFSILIIFSTSFILAFMQWRKTKKDPVGRAALRWFLLSIYMATVLFAGVIIIPAAFQLTPPASQGIMFGAFLLMYWGLALGIVRYRLFSLAQWWHSIMAWFLGGLCVVIFDFLLIASLALPQNSAFPMAVAITGWLYFPLRQKLWEMLSRHQRYMDNWLARVLSVLIDATPEGKPESYESHWIKILARVWQTQFIEKREGGINTPEIIEDGLTLLTPSYINDADHHFRVHCPSQGERLFNSNDLNIFKLLQEITHLAFEKFAERNFGAMQERERIRRDIHDDLGARLLTLLHSCNADQQALVNEALQDTRSLVSTLNPNPIDKIQAINLWQSEIQQRCDLAGVELIWNDVNEALPDIFSARENANISRIFREAVSNAFRHAHPENITINIEGRMLSVTNDGELRPKSEWQLGNGCRIMNERAEEIGGKIDWIINSHCTLILHLPPK